MRKLFIYWLFLSLSMKKKLEVMTKISSKMMRLALEDMMQDGLISIDWSTKKKRRSHKRWPYKTKNKMPETKITAEEIHLGREPEKHHYPQERAYRWYYVDELKRLDYGETKYFTGELSKIAASVCATKKKLNKNFKCSKCWPNTVEVTRTR